MADFSVPFTVPDDKVADLLEALKDRYGTSSVGQTRTRLKQEIIDAVLRPAYLEWRRKNVDFNDLDVT